MDAHIVRSIRVGASFQKQLYQLQVTPLSGDIQGSPTHLGETHKNQEITRHYRRPLAYILTVIYIYNLYTYIHTTTYTHTYTYTYTQPHTHKYIQTHIHTHKTYIHTHTTTYIQTHTCTHMLIHTCLYTRNSISSYASLGNHRGLKQNRLASKNSYTLTQTFYCCTEKTVILIKKNIVTEVFVW